MTAIDDDDMGDLWRSVKAMRQEKRASNRTDSAAMLRDAGISFDEKNLGAHLVIRAGEQVIDFWPGTGLWIVRGQTTQHRGVRSLIAACKRGM